MKRIILLAILICFIGCSSKIYIPNAKNIRSVNVDEKDKTKRIVVFEMKDGSVTKQEVRAGTKIIYNDKSSKLEAY